MSQKLVIGTRGSRLAVIQTQWVMKELSDRYPKCQFEIKEITTSGDMAKDVPFGSINLKGVFTKELDEALLANQIDFAVHSLKDLSSDLPKGIELAAVTEREDPRDAFISKSGKKLIELPPDSVVGTSSLRREALVRQKRKDLRVKPLRGNVETRLGKLKDGQYDAIILAAAGLKRLGVKVPGTEFLEPFEFIPAVGQGMLAITCRTQDPLTKPLLSAINHPIHRQIAEGERRFMARIMGGCQVPMGCFGNYEKETLRMAAFLSKPDGSKFVRSERRGKLSESISMADDLADFILKGVGS